MAQYIYYEDPVTGDIYRDGVRNGKYVIDKRITELGFDGQESQDGGITGDWVNLEEWN